MATTRSRAVNLALQLHAIRRILPHATGKIRRGELNCTVRLTPSEYHATYTVNLRYRHGRHPDVSVTDPPLTLHPSAMALPHVYPGNKLCLYYPGEWKQDTLLANTVLPWTSEWLYHYEIWLATGEWTGGGHHREPRPPAAS